MKITVIGCGNAFSTKNFNQCFMLQEADRTMLVDFGFQIPAALSYHKIDIKSIDDVYISHAHSDHVGGLEHLAFSRYDWQKRPVIASESENKPPRLICNAHLMDELWKKTLSGGLESMEGFDATLETFFELMPIHPNQKFIWCGWTCSLVQQVHIMTGSIIMNTFGLMMEKLNHSTIYFTTDSQHCSPKQMEVFYKKANIIFQDCECIGVDMEKKELRFSSGVHANYAQLAGYKNTNSINLPDTIKNKMYLSHYQDFVSENRDFFGSQISWEKVVKNDGFKGLCHVGDTYEV